MGLCLRPCRVRPVESLQNEANLAAQVCFGIFAVSNAVLDQNWMEERHERALDRSRGFRGIFNLELACFDTLAYDCLEDRHHPLVVALMVVQFSCMAATIRSCMCFSLTSVILMWW